MKINKNILLFALLYLILFLPTYIYSYQYNWSRESQSHGFIVLFIVAYLIYTRLPSIQFKLDLKNWEKIIGWLFVVMGLIIYVVGRSQRILILDLGAQIPILLGATILLTGFKASKIMWFPALFIIFMLPIPQAFLTAVTLPMKLAVSSVAEWVIYHLSNIPVARNGVMLFVGQYRLFVADACAGMGTLISLEALGLLYLDLVKHNSLVRNITLATLIIPISFTANVIRVIVLILITYYFGNEVGQSYIHGYAGMILFVVSLTLIISIDSLIQVVLKKQSSKHLVAS
jgi:exosortase B